MPDPGDGNWREGGDGYCWSWLMHMVNMRGYTGRGFNKFFLSRRQKLQNRQLMEV